MQRTRMARSGDASQVGGFRRFGEQRIFSFDALIGSQRQALTIGRGAGCDISLPDPTVSAVHATVALDASARDALAPVFLLRDRDSKNGIDASARGLRGPFVRVRSLHLALGLYVRIGAFVLVAVDRDGGCPIVASSESDFLTQALALYGSAEEAARFIGLPARRVRERLARIDTLF
ncbi:MAG TPA: FHA domain-containing protein [Haliangium sp.]|nr:FHA domain-containing protein [Haliangium sp.]